jgi:redox-sensitive bicupin YhaK (pirin superfamily)
MVEVTRFDDLGRGDFGWLKARYHFSFARYYNPARLGFGSLLVVNDDRIAPGAGFAPHPHENMEIITYVRSGEVRHRDSLGHEGVTPAGSVQVMSAGTGITHAEYGSDTQETTLYQIWITPRQDGVAPRWETTVFPTTAVEGALPLLLSGRAEDAGQAPLFIHADAALYGGRMEAGTTLTQPVGDRAYVLISEGEVLIQGTKVAKGDAVSLLDEGEVQIKAITHAEVLVIALPR